MSYSSATAQSRVYSLANCLSNLGGMTSGDVISYNNVYRYSNPTQTKVLDWNKLVLMYKCINPPKSNSEVGVKAMIGGDKVDIMNIMFDNKVYSLNSRLSILMTYDKGHYLIDYDPLNIYVCEKTRDDAINDFSERFDMLWANYVEDAETPLSRDALELKEKLVRLVKEVNCV